MTIYIYIYIYIYISGAQTVDTREHKQWTLQITNSGHNSRSGHSNAHTRHASTQQMLLRCVSGMKSSKNKSNQRAAETKTFFQPFAVGMGCRSHGRTGLSTRARECECVRCQMAVRRGLNPWRCPCPSPSKSGPPVTASPPLLL